MTTHQPIVADLIALLKSRPDLTDALKESIRKADVPDVASLPQYCDFLNEMVSLIPTDRSLTRVISKFYYLIGLSPGGLLGTDASFQLWSRTFAEDWGSFLDTTASAKEIKGFFPDPSYHIEDYCQSPSGWLTFNQFFARQVRPGKRPVEGLCDDGVIVSPADSVYQGQWPIAADSKITVKGLTWSLLQLLDGSPDQDRFRGGTFTHSFLDVNGGSDIVMLFEAGKVRLEAKVGTHCNQGRRIGHVIEG